MKRLEFFKTVALLWNGWTEPDPVQPNSRQRLQSRLLASLLLAGIGLTIITTIFRNFPPPPGPLFQNQLIAAFINVALLTGLYLLARQGRYYLAALLTSAAASFSIVIAAVVIGGRVGLHTLYYLSVVIVFSSMFLSQRTTLVVFVMHVALMLAGGALAPSIPGHDIIMGAVLFDFVMTVVTLLVVSHRSRWEREQNARLIESEQRHRVIADMLSDYAYVLAVEPDGTLRLEWSSESVNRLIELGVDLTRLQDTVKNIHPDDQSLGRQHFQNIASGTIQWDELRYIFLDREYWLRLTHLPVIVNGQVTQVYGAVQNITGHKVAQQRHFEETMARERYDLVHGFFRAVSHDFRTSLSVIKTNQYLLQMLVKRGEYDQLETRLNQINEQVDRLTRQLENLKLVSALNSPTRPCDPNDLIQREIGEHASLMAAKGVQVDFLPDPTAPMIAVNPDEVQRAVGHLLENAIHFSPTGSHVTLRIEHQADQVKLSVTDKGPGIAPEEQERIFEFFYRGNEARSITSGGIGLGLSIAKIVAEAYGGKLTVDSAPGNGSTFTLTIPAA